ncbi:fructosamine kinase family protein [Kineosporia sp. J2-2]|uniref:Fructosamine kinase family protein n=2 Tax=Kineosporia corallincola TaxID=2835133 RepID=A0ABS5THT2_9ACTN|nr:fructosamine kinase family protein [Kineosporia corallincola]MBT0770656.1 fructosamine kinase family protein [Kineosporia corallincola]
MTFTKRDPHAAEGFYRTEAAGLRWLGAATADGGLPVAEVLEVTATSITLPRYPTAAPTPEQAREFGRRLALTHRAGAAHHGAPPPGLGDGFIATLPLPHLAESPSHWGDFYAGCRVEPFARAAADDGGLSRTGLDVVLRLCERLHHGDPALTGPEVPAARLHGDLWSGNVLWTTHGPLLIDPAAHGGHPETDLAMLALFGLPHLDLVLDAYTGTAPLPDGWADRAPLHQLHPLLVHAVLFGPSYGEQAVRAAEAAGALA